MDDARLYDPPPATRQTSRLITRAVLREAVRDAGRDLRLAQLKAHPPSAFFWAACDAMWARVSAVLA